MILKTIDRFIEKRLTSLLERQVPEAPADVVISEPNLQLYSSMGIPIPKNMTEQLRAYQTWVYSCVRVIKDRIASLELNMVRKWRDSEGLNTEIIYEHPFVDLLARPNPRYTRFEFWELTSMHLDLTGNCYWLIVDDVIGIPRELWILRPDWIKALPTGDGSIAAYRYTVGAHSIDIPAENILHFKYPNPTSDVYGASPIQAQAHAYDITLFTLVYQSDFFKRGAMVDLALETDQHLTQPQVDKIWENWNKRHTGIGVSRRPAILTDGMKAKPLTMPSKDLEFVLLSEWTRDQILSAYGVPASKIGLVKDVNRANADANNYTFNAEAILPRVMRIEERIEAFLIPRYPSPSVGWLETDFENPIPEDKDQAMRQEDQDLNRGVRTIDDIRADRGLPPVEWGSTPWFPLNLTQVSPLPESEEEVPAERVASPRIISSSQSMIESAIREQVWKGFLASIGPKERKMESILKKLFSDMLSEMLKNLDTVADKIEGQFSGWSERAIRKYLKRDPQLVDAILIDEDKWFELFIDSLIPVVALVVEEQMGLALDAIGFAGEFEVFTENVVAHLETKSVRITNVVTSTREAVRAQMIEGVAAGEGVEELAKRVREEMTHASRTRSHTIARTEVAGSANFANIEAYSVAGIEEKEWLSARDERVRETHAEADGQRIGTKGYFQVGGTSLAFPGDPDGPPEEVINCRCTVIPVIAE